jgi:hypothetical protein
VTRDDIIKLARQHGKPVQEQYCEVEYLFTLDGVEALLVAEREACADICDQHATCEGVAQLCAEAIRARGQA